MIGVLFDVAVCYLGKNLDLYGAQENDRRREFIKEDDIPQTADGEKKKKEMNGNVNWMTKKLSFLPITRENVPCKIFNFICSYGGYKKYLYPYF